VLLAAMIVVACSSLGIGQAVRYNPPKPEDAPQDIRDAVMLGHDIMTKTKATVPDHVGNEMNCSNCHFDAGLTQGGKNGGISLVGVAATYPKYRDRQKYAVNMVTRLND
jgi:thiosulfate dehydrogenase